MCRYKPISVNPCPNKISINNKIGSKSRALPPIISILFYSYLKTIFKAVKIAPFSQVYFLLQHEQTKLHPTHLIPPIYHIVVTNFRCPYKKKFFFMDVSTLSYRIHFLWLRGRRICGWCRARGNYLRSIRSMH